MHPHCIPTKPGRRYPTIKLRPLNDPFTPDVPEDVFNDEMEWLLKEAIETLDRADPPAPFSPRLH